MSKGASDCLPLLEGGGRAVQARFNKKAPRIVRSAGLEWLIFYISCNTSTEGLGVNSVVSERKMYQTGTTTTA
jgi:hypothetical protein